MTSDLFSLDSAWPYTRAKTAVLAAASSVIREDGPRAATLKNIATKAGITEPAIFRHFDGVDGLFAGLFSVYELLNQRFSQVFETEGQGMAKLKEASFAFIDVLAASKDFSYILVYARHVFRGYADLKAKVGEYDVKIQKALLDRIAEGVKAGEIRADVDPASAAISLLGGLYVTSVLWIESGLSFDLKEIYADRWDDFERLVSSKPSVRSRAPAAASRERSASCFPLRLPAASKAKASTAKKALSKTVKAAAPKAKAAKAAPRKQIAAKAVAKKPSTRTK